MGSIAKSKVYQVEIVVGYYFCGVLWARLELFSRYPLNMKMFALILFLVLVLILDCMCLLCHHLFHAVTKSLQTSTTLLKENCLMALEGEYYSH